MREVSSTFVAVLDAVGAWDEEFAAATARSAPQHRQRLGACLPSPFVSLWGAPAAVREAWNAGDPQPLVDFLRTPRSLRRPFLSPLLEQGAIARAEYPADAAGLLTSGIASRRALIDARTRMLEAAEALWSPRPSVEPASGTRRVPGRVSVVFAFDGHDNGFPESVRATLRSGAEADVECVVMDVGAPVEAALDMVASSIKRPALRYDPERRPSTVSAAFQHGLRACTGERVVFVGPGIRLQPGWLAPLIAALDDEHVLAAQPVVADRTYGIVSAGLTAEPASGLVTALLEGYALEDRDHIQSVDVPALGGGVVAARAEDVEAAGGWRDGWSGVLLEADLCFRLAELRSGRFAVVPERPVTALAEAKPATPTECADFAARWGRKVARTSSPRSSDVLAAAAARRSRGARRWGLYISSSPGPAGDVWGDTAFAGSLAAGLRQLGQEVVVYRREHHSRPGCETDDVVLAIRGLTPVQPKAGKANVLWVVSHPDEVTPDELDGYDLVYAASGSWAADMSLRSGREVRPLLQAVDSQHVPPPTQAPGPGEVPVFVGTGKNRDRPIVRDALEAGISLAVYGPGWRGKLPPGHLRGDRVPNDGLIALYRHYGLVLADHWPDMAEHGFLSNRIFDAVAAGCRVICAPVAADLGLFEGAVVSYTSPEHLHELVSSPDVFPPADVLVKVGQRIVREHSFAARAQQLATDVAALLG